MEIKDFQVELEGFRLGGQLYMPPTTGEPHPALLLCHGLPRRSAPDPHDGGYPALAERCCQQGFLTAIFNFRGTGRSEGNLDILGWTRDLKAVLNYVYELEEVDRARIAVMGFSAGAPAAIYTVARDPRVCALVACASPTVSRIGNSRGLAQHLIDQFRQMGIIKDEGFPPSLERWMQHFSHVYELEWVTRIAPRPLLVIHGTADDVVPVDNSRDLYQHAGEPKDIAIIEGAGHRLRLEPEAMDCALEWLSAHVLRD